MPAKQKSDERRVKKWNGHDDCIGGVVLSTEATGERGRQWQKMMQKPGKNSQYWHKLDVDE
uniref:Uncharacterized protein n=1 Tax=Meloidogyne incognita TaxID=6306 RepID=A0A914LAV8_MELIC